MGLYETLERDMKAALKAGDSEKLSTLRMVMSAVKMIGIDKNVKTVDDADIISVFQRQIKQHKESIDQFRKGNRADLAEKEARELKILERYLPEQLGEAELIAIIKEAIASTGAIAKADMGKVMKIVIEKAKGRCDGKLVNQLVSGMLK